MEFKSDKELNDYVLAFMKKHSSFIHLLVDKVAYKRAEYKDLMQDVFIILRDRIKYYDPIRTPNELTYLGTVLKDALFRRAKAYELVHLPEYRYREWNMYKKGEDTSPRAYESYQLVEKISITKNIQQDIFKHDSNKFKEHAIYIEDKDKKVFNDWLKNKIKNTISKFSDREKYILDRYYGLDGEEPEILLDISKAIGLSLERTRQIKIRALKRLKSRIENYYSENIGDLFDD